MTITHGFHATIPAHPGKGDALVELLLKAPALDNDDCLVFLVGRSAASRDEVFVTEGWTSQDAHRRFFASDIARAFTAEVGALVAGEPRYVDEVPVGGKAAIG
jgi:quinol monooxygenase YgiN